LSVTELAHWLAGSSQDFDIYSADEFLVPRETGLSEALSPRETGLIFHAVMEILDPQAPCPRELIAAEAERLGLVTEIPAGLAASIEFFLDSPLGQSWLRAVSDGRAVFREWPFQLRLLEYGGQTRSLKVNGIIDLFFQTPDGGRIVDYKFAAFPRGGGGGTDSLSAYENQVRLYALALRSAGLAENPKAVLYFAGGTRPHFHEVDLEAGWTTEFWTKKIKSFFNEVKTSLLRL